MDKAIVLTEVKDRFGRKHHVLMEDLVGTRTQLRLYHPRSKKRYSEELGDKHGTSMHRANICPHPFEQFEVFEALGELSRQCPICKKRVKESVARLVHESERAKRIAEGRATEEDIRELATKHGWKDSELSHAMATRSCTYENEIVLPVEGGRKLCAPAQGPCDYVRVVQDGLELMCWSADEWAVDPETVMGAIIGILREGAGRT